MSTETKATRHLHLEMMTRIEGEGGISIELENGALKNVTLDIFEPPRLFEAFLRGRSIDELPDIVARICGICPVAHQLTAAQAVEDALGITLSPDIRALRQLLYFGEWIQSHVLHIFFLQLPDLLGCPDALVVARDHPLKVQEALRMKKIGNHIMETVGGRAIHPVNVCVGGFYRAPSASVVKALRDDVAWLLEASLQTVPFLASLPLPKLEREVEFVSLSRPDEYAILDGSLSVGSARNLKVKDFERSFVERHVAHSNALRTECVGEDKSFFVGPLARLNFNRAQLLPKAQSAMAASGISWPSANPYAGVLARAIELVHSCEGALACIDSYQEPNPCRMPFKLKAGDGHGASEAPRGTLYHNYRINDRGLIEFARIVPPTAQNLRRMEDDLRLLIPGVIDRPDAEILAECEKVMRCYDPCVSCSVHAIRIKRTP